MDIMPDKKQLRAGSTALRKHKPVPVMSSRPGVSVDYSCASCGTRFADLETAREHTVLRIVEGGVEHGGEDAMNISKPISTASRLRATFTSSAAPERAGQTDPRDAQPRSGTPQAAQARGRDAGRDHERTGVLVDRVELSRVGRPVSK